MLGPDSKPNESNSLLICDSRTMKGSIFVIFIVLNRVNCKENQKSKVVCHMVIIQLHVI